MNLLEQNQAKPSGKRYHLRFNTHHATSERPDLVWRVFEDGVEHLVKEVDIRSRVFGENTIEHGVTKWNVCTIGYMNIVDEVAIIYPSEPLLTEGAEESEARRDGMPASKVERHLRRMLCVQRHGYGAYTDDGEASWCGGDHHRAIDYMRESPESIERAWQEADLKSLQAMK